MKYLILSFGLLTACPGKWDCTEHSEEMGAWVEKCASTNRFTTLHDCTRNATEIFCKPVGYCK